MATAAVRLAAYEAAETAILEGGQAYEVDGQKLTRADLGQIQKMIRQLTAEVNAGTAGKSRRNFAGFSRER